MPQAARTHLSGTARHPPASISPFELARVQAFLQGNCQLGASCELYHPKSSRAKPPKSKRKRDEGTKTKPQVRIHSHRVNESVVDQCVDLQDEHPVKRIKPELDPGALAHGVLAWPSASSVTAPVRRIATE